MTHPKLLSLVGLFVFIATTGAAQKKYKRVIISAKHIDKNLAKVADSLYAFKYETSNGEYNFFLGEIKKTNQSLYNKCLVDSTNWALRYGEPMNIYYHRHPAYANYPVVNVSHEAANEYCKWMTEFYNSDPKREFKKVEFTLPTVAEWILAAQGGRSQAMFPWANYYLRDKNGRYMCNMRHLDEINVYRDKDGRVVVADSLDDRPFYTSTVHSFYPNDYGIYNMSGNVAEMTNQHGLTKGGSWNSFGGEVHIRASKIYNQASPEMGFRVFMHVVEF
jgi:formylglycine-generating enzyme